MLQEVDTGYPESGRWRCVWREVAKWGKPLKIVCFRVWEVGAESGTAVELGEARSLKGFRGQE